MSSVSASRLHMAPYSECLRKPFKFASVASIAALMSFVIGNQCAVAREFPKDFIVNSHRLQPREKKLQELRTPGLPASEADQIDRLYQELMQCHTLQCATKNGADVCLDLYGECRSSYQRPDSLDPVLSHSGRGSCSPRLTEANFHKSHDAVSYGERTKHEDRQHRRVRVVVIGFTDCDCPDRLGPGNLPLNAGTPCNQRLENGRSPRRARELTGARRLSDRLSVSG